MKYSEGIPERTWYLIAAILVLLIVGIMVLIYEDAKHKAPTVRRPGPGMLLDLEWKNNELRSL